MHAPLSVAALLITHTPSDLCVSPLQLARACDLAVERLVRVRVLALVPALVPALVRVQARVPELVPEQLAPAQRYDGGGGGMIRSVCADISHSLCSCSRCHGLPILRSVI